VRLPHSRWRRRRVDRRLSEPSLRESPGRGPSISNHIDPAVLLVLLWAKSGRKRDSAFYVTIPPFEKDWDLEDAKRNFRQMRGRPSVSTVYEGMQTVDVVFASVGQLATNAEIRKSTGPAVTVLEGLGVRERDLIATHVVADICYSFIDSNGKSVPKWDLFLALKVDQLRKMAADRAKTVIAVAGGPKEKALRAVLKGNLINVLITDEKVAMNLLRRSRGKE
jgi:hypothetical protein